ncbi:hypothetical protein ANSO36C_36970 [Nostoc cf. commune SO-36]|uniref:CopG family transcriptional regulator n=1 Tax=Nostoc cf. commune SO-36 TaxID=449208 RepID=A0ABM7Z4G7_NOSCO|nr:hypothetical protein ANSO36C_36970 [Nostoc cf. commune SO-36]
MNRPKVYNLRFSDEEWAKLKSYAESKQVTPAEILRDYIKRLPNIKPS